MEKKIAKPVLGAHLISKKNSSACTRHDKILESKHTKLRQKRTTTVVVVVPGIGRKVCAYVILRLGPLQLSSWSPALAAMHTRGATVAATCQGIPSLAVGSPSADLPLPHLGPKAEACDYTLP